jgi:hypothetical protein
MVSQLWVVASTLLTAPFIWAGVLSLRDWYKNRRESKKRIIVPL